MTPLDIEQITGLTEGNIFQGELSLEQLFFNRPVPGWARYRTPIKDLWMCGRPHIPVAGSWARPAGSPRSSSSAARPGTGGQGRLMAKRFDAIVIGAGHNGLTTAAYLAKAGRSVLVLEKRDRVGGILDTVELAAGVRGPASSTRSVGSASR